MRVVREDEQGIYVKNNGQKHRPGRVRGYYHAFDMDDGGLKKGDRVGVRNINHSPLCRIRLKDGRTLYWHSE